ncbi:MAG: SAVMC3_10250 family protein [Streptosporangiaceae bacterium]
MRELIYLSDQKLEQFLPDPIPKWRRLGRLKAEVKAPIGSLSVEPPANDDQSAKATQLQRVVRQVEQTAQWFTADGVRAGDWIFFEERINYWVIQLSRGSAIVLFLNLDHAETRRTRLLLHGSPEHLLSGKQAQDGLRLGSPGPSPSDGSWFRDMLPVVRKVMRSVDSASKKQKPHEARNLGWDLEDVVLALDKSNSPATAMWLAGYARVTARMESSSRSNIKAALVAASPLYVELLMPPDGEDEPLLSPR